MYREGYGQMNVQARSKSRLRSSAPLVNPFSRCIQGGQVRSVAVPEPACSIFARCTVHPAHTFASIARERYSLPPVQDCRCSHQELGVSTTLIVCTEPDDPLTAYLRWALPRRGVPAVCLAFPLDGRSASRGTPIAACGRHCSAGVSHGARILRSSSLTPL